MNGLKEVGSDRPSYSDCREAAGWLDGSSLDGSSFDGSLPQRQLAQLDASEPWWVERCECGRTKSRWLRRRAHKCELSKKIGCRRCSGNLNLN